MAGTGFFLYGGAGLGALLVVFGAARTLAARRGVPFATSAGLAEIPGWVLVLTGAALIAAALLWTPGGTGAPLFTR
ncbi:MAG: hypothetical protein IH608_06840 [Proteobacteria bacterium]|nr:hypothetical protein [Pseudomonadota bacterium]